MFPLKKEACNFNVQFIFIHWHQIMADLNVCLPLRPYVKRDSQYCTNRRLAKKIALELSWNFWQTDHIEFSDQNSSCKCRS